MNVATEPAIRVDGEGDNRWMTIHQRFVEETKEREPEVLFVGDSLIAHLKYTEIWKTLFAPLHPLNFGISGDETQHILWRLSNGELDNIKPKVVVLMVGTNNHGHTPEMIASGIMAIIDLLAEKQPQAHVVAMSLLPRGRYVNPLRERNSRVNELLEQKMSLMPSPPRRAQLVKCDSDLVQADGSISHLDLYDYLHLSPQGQRKVFEPVHDLLVQLLAESQS